MLARATLAILTAFWVTMNVLLWRAEYGSTPALGSTVPPEVVWDKILTAPDSSSLTIFYKGKKIGFCHWITSVGEDLAKMSSGETPPEGMVRKIAGYRLELNGNVMLSDTDRLRFDSHLDLGTDCNWRNFDVRLGLRPSSWEVQSVASEQTVRLNWQDDAQRYNRVIKFSELENPQALLQEFVGPLGASALGSLDLPVPQDRARTPTLSVHWQARQDSAKFGHSSIRAYRLEANLIDRFKAVVFVSRVGEILRVELPEGIVLANDQLGGN
jgi:hypothetical protein